MKICYKCKGEKDESEFNKKKSRKDGLQSFCKSCEKNIINGITQKTNRNMLTVQQLVNACNVNYIENGKKLCVVLSAPKMNR